MCTKESVEYNEQKKLTSDDWEVMRLIEYLNPLEKEKILESSLFKKNDQVEICEEKKCLIKLNEDEELEFYKECKAYVIQKTNKTEELKSVCVEGQIHVDDDNRIISISFNLQVSKEDKVYITTEKGKAVNKLIAQVDYISTSDGRITSSESIKLMFEKVNEAYCTLIELEEQQQSEEEQHQGEQRKVNFDIKALKNELKDLENGIIAM